MNIVRFLLGSLAWSLALMLSITSDGYSQLYDVISILVGIFSLTGFGALMFMWGAWREEN